MKPFASPLHIMNHFLKETDFKRHEVAEIFSLATAFKKLRNQHTPPTLEKQSWGMLFFKKSTRTRVSFEVGIQELGGRAVLLNGDELQLTRGESIADTAKVLSQYLHGLIIRSHEHEIVETFAQEGTVPVINALTKFLHPCQIYADAFTLTEHWGHNTGNPLKSLEKRKITFLGDSASNMANSWLLGANLFGMEITVSGPQEFEPTDNIKALLRREGFDGNYTFTSDPQTAVQDADVVYTDVWVSMGDETETPNRIAKMRPYSVTQELMARAKPDAYFMHCMPAHRGQEVSAKVLDSPRSLLLDQAENRLHIQKAILSVIGNRLKNR